MADEAPHPSPGASLTWRRRVVYAFVLYLAIAGLVEHGIYSFGSTFLHMGRASPKPYLPFALTPDFRPNRLHRLIGGTTISTNSLGYHDDEIVVPKPRGTIRIVVLGGSTTFLPLEAPYPHLLENLFAARRDDLGGSVTVDVINASMKGYSVVEHEIQLRREFLDKQVDVLIVSEPWNYQRMTTYFARESEERSVIERLVGKLPLYGQLSYFVQAFRFLSTRDELPPPDLEFQLDGYMAKVDEIRALCEHAGIQLVLGLHPDAWGQADSHGLGRVESYDLDSGGVDILWPEERIRFKRMALERLRAYAAERRLPSIDWESQFVVRAVPDSMFQATRAHVTPEGSQLMAEIAYQALLPLVTGSIEAAAVSVEP